MEVAGFGAPSEVQDFEKIMCFERFTGHGESSFPPCGLALRFGRHIASRISVPR
jgi:hypothetical protein